MRPRATSTVASLSVGSKCLRLITEALLLLTTSSSFSSDYDPADPTAATWALVDVTETAPTAPATKYTAEHVLPELNDGDDETSAHGQTRHYRVRAVNVVGEGENSDVATGMTHNVPAAPTGLAAVAGDLATVNADPPGPQQGRITITWDPVAEENNGGLAITDGDAGYILEFSEDPDAATPVWTELTGETAPDATATPPTTQYRYVHDLSSLDPSYDLTRHYRVRAVNAAGEGMNSDVEPGKTHDVPAAPTGLATGAVAVNADGRRSKRHPGILECSA